MKDSHRTLAAELRLESSKVKGSRFVATAAPVDSAAAIDAVLARVRKEFWDATHHPFAWRLSATAESFRSSDDGEPAGSSGKPILQQIDAFDLSFVLVVVTRYFGGTQLGVGGLARAYAAAAEGVLRSARIVEVYEMRTLDLAFPIERMGNVQSLLSSYQLKPSELRVVDDARLTVSLRASLLDAFLAEFRDCTRGKGGATLK